MAGDDKDGYYCSICGGIPPDKIKTKKILIDGRETGIDQLDWILDEVKNLKLADDNAITEELLKRRQRSTTCQPGRRWCTGWRCWRNTEDLLNTPENQDEFCVQTHQTEVR